MSWVGGKKALREEIVRRFPIDYERYIEVFGGGGWVLFHKSPGRAWYYQIIRYSYASGLSSYASQPHDMWSNFPLIDQAHRRLAKVVIENQDFEELIRHYDRENSFFYLDPPYHNTKGYYQNIGEGGFTEEDHIRLHDTLLSPNFQGKFLLSYNDDKFVRDLYDAPGIWMVETTRLNTIKQRFEKDAQFPELLIANYNTERQQITLF